MAERNIFRIIFEIEALDGGLNNKYEPAIIGNTEASDCLNVVFDDRGGVQTRGGASKFNTTSVGSFAGDGLFTARFEDGTEQMLGWWNGTMYKLTGTTFTTVPSAQSVYTAGERVCAQMYQDLMFFGNGYSKPYKYNGTDFNRHGIPQPNSVPADTSGTATATAVPTGDVLYKVSYMNSFSAEGDVSAANTTLTVATTASVSLTSIPLAPTSFGVTARRLYRRDASTGGVYKLVTTISDNTTTTYLDGTGTLSLGASAPTDNGEPANYKNIVTHKERLFTVDNDDPNFVKYSELANPFVFKTTNIEKAGTGDGETISGGLAIHANSVMTFKSSSIWALYMEDTDPTNWQMVKTLSKYGGASGFAIAEYSSLLLFIGKRYGNISGFHTLQGLAVRPNITDLTITDILTESQSDKIEPDVFQFRSGSMAKAHAIEFKNKLYFAVPYGTAQTTNNRVYVFDFQRRDKDQSTGAWTPLEYPWSISAFTIYGNELYAQSQTANGFVYKLEQSTYADDGTAIDSYWQSKEFYGYDEHRENWKDFRVAFATVELLGAYTMDFTVMIDGDPIGSTRTIDLTPSGSLWGSVTWGAFTWGGADTRARKTALFLGQLSGKTIQFKFSNDNTVNQGFHVFSPFRLSYNVRGIR